MADAAFTLWSGATMKGQGAITMVNSRCIHNRGDQIMIKPHRLSMSFKRLISILSVSAVIIITGGSACAEVQNCTVGDTSKGYWSQVSTSQQCPLPGPPAADSPWPKISSDGSISYGGGAYRIEGRYKMVLSSMCAEGFSLSPPPARAECLTGYAAAYAAVSAAVYQRPFPEPQPACCRTTYTAAGSLVIYHYTDTRNGGSETYNYCRYYECGFSLYEWVCNPAEPIVNKQNQGYPPCATQ